MQYGEALKLIGGLGQPSKMPWWSWSISAERCKVGGQLAQQEGTVCSGCYALKGNYRWEVVRRAHERRFQALQDPLFVKAFALVLNHLFTRQRAKENRFRWLDSGDLQDVAMLDKINEIALLTPDVRHWLPTRELRIVADWLAAHPEGFAHNLTVRVSTAKVGVVPKQQPFGLPMSTVGADTNLDLHQCPARAHQGNKCLDCAVCWSKENVNYPFH